MGLLEMGIILGLSPRISAFVTNLIFHRAPGPGNSVEFLLGDGNWSDANDAGIGNDLNLLRCHFFPKKESKKISSSQTGRAKIVGPSLVRTKIAKKNELLEPEKTALLGNPLSCLRS
jgi:hypothetical protein